MSAGKFAPALAAAATAALLWSMAATADEIVPPPPTVAAPSYPATPYPPAPYYPPAQPVVVIPPGSYLPPPLPLALEGPPDPMAGRPGVVFRGELIASYRYALRESWGSGGFMIYLGGEHQRVGISGTFAVDGGRSAAGLSFMTYQWGIEIAGRITERLRLGINPHFGAIAIQDATDGEWNMSAFIGGVTIDATYDLILHRGHALYLVAKAGVDYIDVQAQSPADEGALGTNNYAASLTASLGLGFRL